VRALTLDQIFDNHNYDGTIFEDTDLEMTCTALSQAPENLLSPDGIPIRRVPAPLARRFQQICTSMVAKALENTGVVQLEYAVLVFIDDVPGIDQRTLAQAMGIDRNNVSLIIDRLEKNGLVARRVNGTDRRSRGLHLTRKGNELRRRTQPKVRAANQRILAPLKAADQKIFIEMLVRLVEGNRAYARPGTGRRKRRRLLSSDSSK
jgi:DNA-binding MarR family transcriptional regulator